MIAEIGRARDEDPLGHRRAADHYADFITQPHVLKGRDSSTHVRHCRSKQRRHPYDLGTVFLDRIYEIVGT